LDPFRVCALIQAYWPDQLLFGTQSIFNIVAALPVARFVQTAGELCDLVVRSMQSTTGVLSHAHFTRDARRDAVSYPFHDF
jgi:hypothetical protein